MPFLKCGPKIKRTKLLEISAHKEGLRHTIPTPWKDYYTGDWHESRKQGYGQIHTRSKRFYQGNWLQDYRHFFGRSAHKDEENVLVLEYRGNWKWGHYGGYGEKHYPDGAYYKGYMKNSKRHGYGQMWYANGAFYDGDWRKDLKAGLGMFVYSDGNRYEGEWKSDMKHGKGRYYHLDSGQFQEGVWTNNICVTSFMEDIPFRQSAVSPTKFAIFELELQTIDEVYKAQESEALAANQIQPLVC